MKDISPFGGVGHIAYLSIATCDSPAPFPVHCQHMSCQHGRWQESQNSRAEAAFHGKCTNPGGTQVTDFPPRGIRYTRDKL